MARGWCTPQVITGAIFHQIGLFASRGWVVQPVPLAFMCFATACGVATLLRTAALGRIKGVVNAMRNGATALGPPIVALLIRPDGSYATRLAVLAALSALAGLGLLSAKPPAT